MISRKILPLILTVFLSFSALLLSCNWKDTTDNAADLLKEGVDKTGEAVKDVGEAGKDIVTKIKDTSMDYSEDSFKADIEQKGYKLQKSTDSQSLFSISNNDYIINGERLSIYEYDKEDRGRLEEDLRTIADNGTVINGLKMNWTTAPHIYKKGRIVVVYDGNNETTLTALKEVLGDPIIG